MFSHIPDEAMSGGLVKACVQRKKCSVPEKFEFLIKSWDEMKDLIQLKLCNANINTYTSHFMEIQQ